MMPTNNTKSNPLLFVTLLYLLNHFTNFTIRKIASGNTIKKNVTGAVIIKNTAPPTMKMNQNKHPPEPLLPRLLILHPLILYYSNRYPTVI